MMLPPTPQLPDDPEETAALAASAAAAAAGDPDSLVVVAKEEVIQKALHPPFERCRYETLEIMKATEVIANCVKYIPAVCRIAGRGTATLISKISENVGVLLTTTYVVSSKQEAVGLSAVFFEEALFRTPVEVALRPQKLYFAPDQVTAPKKPLGTNLWDTVLNDHYYPYCVVACDLIGKVGGNIFDVQPVSLPVTIKQLTDSQLTVRDVNLLVQHPNGGFGRKYHVNEVKSSTTSVCTYKANFMYDYQASGGPIFSERGDFVGVSHQSIECSYAIKIRAIMTDLFQRNMLGALKLKICEEDPSTVDRFTAEGERIPNPYNGFTYFQEIWRTWFSEHSAFADLVHVLYAFPYSPPLLMYTLREITLPENVVHLPRMASEGGIWPILQVMDLHPYNTLLMELAVSTLGCVSLPDCNRPAIAEHEGISAMLHLIEEFASNEQICRWAIYTLLNLCEHNEENKATLVRLNGLPVVTSVMQAMPHSEFVQRRAIALMGHLSLRNVMNQETVVGLGGLTQMMAAVRAFPQQEVLLEDVMFTAHIWIRQSEVLSEQLWEEDVRGVALNALRACVEQESAIIDTLGVISCLSLQKEAYFTSFASVGEEIASLVFDATLRFAVSRALLSAAISAYVSLRLDPTERFERNTLADELLHELLQKS